MSNSNIHPIHSQLIPKPEKEKLLGQKGMVFWHYGLSGSGKSTLVLEMEKRLHHEGIHSVVLDGDNLRSGLNKDLGFSDDDRRENIRRVSELAKILAENGIIVLVSLISPLHEFRSSAKAIIGEESFHEIYIQASFAACKERDVKGLYAKAESGNVKSFTGKESSFEVPESAHLIINTEEESKETSVNKLYSYIRNSISI